MFLSKTEALLVKLTETSSLARKWIFPTLGIQEKDVCGLQDPETWIVTEINSPCFFVFVYVLTAAGILCSAFYSSDSSNVVLASVASASSRKLLEMQILGPIPDLLNQKLWRETAIERKVWLGVWCSNLCLIGAPDDVDGCWSLRTTVLRVRLTISVWTV